MTPTECSRSLLQSVRGRVGRIASSWIVACLATASASAQGTGPTLTYQVSGFVATLPSDSNYSRENQLRIDVDTRWPLNFGYRPIHVGIRSERPTTAEHHIKIRIHVAAGDLPDLEVDQSFDLPLGATGAKTIVRCPQYQAAYRYWWDVWIDGQRDSELSFDAAASRSLQISGINGSAGPAIKILLVGPLAESGRSGGAGSALLETYTLGVKELPTQWIDYSAFDVVAISPSDLAALAQTRPEAITALRRWVRTGGQLWVHPLGDDWQQLGDVERLLELAPSGEVVSPDKIPAADPIRTANRWQPVKLGARARPRGATVQYIPTGQIRVVRDPSQIERLKLNPDYLVTEEDTPSPGEPALVGGRSQPVDTANWYVERPLGLGRVRAYRTRWDPVGFSISWQMLAMETFNPAAPTARPSTPLTTAIESTRDWQSRHGMEPDLANEDFADLLVPGVGLAPVNEFRVLITLFVLVIGPLSYWLLMRSNRLYLMLLTVPVIAAGLTAGLFAYALFSDGLSTTVRVRSFTSLDQSTGEAATWARLSYYAGLAPSRGLVLPDDVAFYPILPGWYESSDNTTLGVMRKLAWSDGQQRLTGGWLRSRVPTQYLSVRSRKSPYRLHLEPQGDELQATNHLDSRLLFVAAIDERTNVFVGESIDDGATARLKPSTTTDALRELRQRMLENQPELPPALADEQDSVTSVDRRGRRRMLRRRYELEYGVERLSENLLSGALAALVQNSPDGTFNLPPKTFVAITETGPEVESGIEDVDEQASFHVLVGNW